MKIELKAIGNEDELHAFAEMLREGGASVFITDAGKLGFDVGTNEPGQQFIRRVPGAQVCLTLSQMDSLSSFDRLKQVIPGLGD